MSEIPSWARVGAKVVLAGYDGPGCTPKCERSGRLRRGSVYTISHVRMGSVGPAILVREAPAIVDGQVRWFRLRGFRPLVHRSLEHDISQYFKPLLDTPHQKEPA